MGTLISGLFKNSDHAGMAIAELKSKDLDKDISVMAKDKDNGEISAHDVDSDPMHGAKGGAIAGAAVGGLGALAVGASAVTLPGLGLVVAGPLATILAGITGGAVTGGVVGALVDQGFSEEKARDFESEIKKGQVFASVHADEDNANEIAAVFKQHGASKVEVLQK